MNDLTFAFRQLLKNPGFTAAAVLTLALGIGANLAIFGILNELLLRPRPVNSPDELWAITPADSAGRPIPANVTRPYYDAIRRHQLPFKAVIGHAGISHGFWQSQFGGAADVIGKTVTLNDKVVEVVGVAPPGFSGLGVAQPSLWMPVSMEMLMDQFTSYRLVGRLADPGQAPTAAELVAPIVAEVTKELAGFTDPQWFRYGYHPNFQNVRLEPIGRGLLGMMFGRERVLGFLRFASVATVLLLLIACANVASLFLARAMQRRKEIATRLGLGATRARLVRQLVGEGILVSALGTVAALLVFSWIGTFMMKLGNWWRDPALALVLDWRVFLFAAGCALAVGLVFSLAPALQVTRIELFNALKSADSGDTSTRTRGWLRQGLIVAQIVGSLLLLCGATLCLRSMNSQLAADVGFQTARLAVAPLNLERIGFTTNTVAPQLAEITRRVALIPGVWQVGVSRSEPFDGSESGMGLPQLDGYRSPDGGPVFIHFADVGPDTFAALGVPVLRGREINHIDLELGRKVVVVNESFVRKFWPDQEPLGKQIQNDEVVGVVRDARVGRFDVLPPPMMFRSASREDLLYPKLIVQAKGNSRHVIAALRAELAAIHPRLVEGEISTLHNTMKNAMGAQRAALQILGVLGNLALALAAIGTYGVMAYLVTRRTREIGIRMALGGTRGTVIRLILFSGLRLGLIALAIGIPLAIGASALLRNQLAGISPFDPVSFLAVTVLVLTALLAACWLPARRAARVDPMEALRCG
jgi:predicted permease